MSSEFARRALVLSPDCLHTLGEIPSYVWDAKHAALCGEDRPLKENDHCCDALRYGVYYDRVCHPSARPSVRVVTNLIPMMLSICSFRQLLPESFFSSRRKSSMSLNCR